MTQELNREKNEGHDVDLSERGRILALLSFVTLIGCDRGGKVPEQSAPIPVFSSEPAWHTSVKNQSDSGLRNPLICINGYVESPDRISPRIGAALRRSGASVERINADNFDVLSSSCDGAFAMGGDDLDTTIIPRNEAVHPASFSRLIPRERQIFDRRFVTWARNHQVPLFGECLGMQEVGVWEGEGAFLNQHLPDHSDFLNHGHSHAVYLNDEASVFGLGSELSVRSRHHQALDDPLPSTLRVVGRSRDKVIEAIISTDGLFWGILWHPRKDTEDERIYENFVKMVATQIKR